MSSNHIVCYLDLLGYTHLVNDHADDPMKLKGIHGVFEGAVKIMEGFKTRPINSLYAEANKKLAHHLKLHMFSDATLFAMPLFNLPQLGEGVSQDDNVIACVLGFLDWVSMFCLFVMGKLGHLYRGGIWIGQHHESDLNDNPNYQFMFSKALVEAYNLERVKPGHPRILLDGSNIGKGLTQTLIDNRYILSDSEDKHLYLDLYGRLDFPRARRVLSEIKDGIPKVARYYRQKHPVEFEQKMCPKYRWWLNYHNQRSKELDFPADIQIASPV